MKGSPVRVRASALGSACNLTGFESRGRCGQRLGSGCGAIWKPETETPPPRESGPGVLARPIHERSSPRAMRRTPAYSAVIRDRRMCRRRASATSRTYTTRVTVASRCPSRNATSSTLSPASSANEATVCRNECIDGTDPGGAGMRLPSASVWWGTGNVGCPCSSVARCWAFRSARATLRCPSGRPERVVNTKRSGRVSGADRLCRERISASSRGIGTVRAEPSVSSAGGCPDGRPGSRTRSRRQRGRRAERLPR